MQLSLPRGGTLRINAYGAGLPGGPKAPGKGVWVGVWAWGEGPQVYRGTPHRTLRLPGYTCFWLQEAAVASALRLRGFPGLALPFFLLR